MQKTNSENAQIFAAGKSQADLRIPAFALNVGTYLIRMIKITNTIAPRNMYENTAHIE
jgi:hypothetical protein